MLAASGNWAQMPIPGPTAGLQNQKLWGKGPETCAETGPPNDSDAL